MTERAFTAWVIYDNPLDYPGKVVVRRRNAAKIRQPVNIAK